MTQALDDDEQANSAFSTSLSLWPSLAAGWLSWGTFCDHMYEKSRNSGLPGQPGNHMWLEYAVTCYLQVTLHPPLLSLYPFLKLDVQAPAARFCTSCHSPFTTHYAAHSCYGCLDRETEKSSCWFPLRSAPFKNYSLTIAFSFFHSIIFWHASSLAYKFHT